MAAKHAVVTVETGTWTRLTDSAGTTGVTTLELLDNVEIWLICSDSGTAPADSTKEGTFLLSGREAGWNNATFAELFPGATDGTHLYARPVASSKADPRVAISHVA